MGWPFPDNAPTLIIVSREHEVIDHRYEIEFPLASGGLGHVYVCHDTRENRRVAVKRFRTDLDVPAEALQQNKLEGIALSELRHPNIVSLYDVGADGEGIFLVMELIEGDTLAHIVRNSPLDIESFISLAQQSLEALAAAHRKGILHLDIKPSNIMLTFPKAGSFHVKLVDFGLARFTHQKKKTEESGMVMGSIYYISPEMILGEPTDARSDLYSLGHVLYYSLTGTPAYKDEDMEIIADRHVNGAPIDLPAARPDVPAELNLWLMNLIKPLPEHRTPSAQEALHALTQISLQYKMQQELAAQQAITPAKKEPADLIKKSTQQLVSLFVKKKNPPSGPS